MLFFWVRAGRTPGMTAVGLRFVNTDGDPTNPQTGGKTVDRQPAYPYPGLSSIGAMAVLGGQPYQDKLSAYN